MKQLLLCLLLLFLVKGDNEYTLTTATLRESTSPKPTTLYRRINVERNVQDRSSTPLNLFRLRDYAARRSRPDIWNWDYWCQLQPKKGSCTQHFLRYYYDSQLDQCLTFNYTGCNGNKNSFETLIDCERHCKGSIYMSLNDTDPLTFCSLQPHAGLCLAMFTQYYYDVNDGICKAFIYGGCGGNQNRFVTKKKCLRHCSTSQYLSE